MLTFYYKKSPNDTLKNLQGTVGTYCEEHSPTSSDVIKLPITVLTEYANLITEDYGYLPPERLTSIQTELKQIQDRKGYEKAINNLKNTIEKLGEKPISFRLNDEKLAEFLATLMLVKNLNIKEALVYCIKHTAEQATDTQSIPEPLPELEPMYTPLDDFEPYTDWRMLLNNDKSSN